MLAIKKSFQILNWKLLLSLFFTLDKLLKAKSANRKIMAMIYAIASIYLLVIGGTVLYTRSFLKLMSTSLISYEVVAFVRVELATRFLIMTIKLITIFLIAKAKWKTIILILLFRILTNFGLDLFIVGNDRFSLELGIVWIALNQLFITFLTTITGGW